MSVEEKGKMEEDGEGGGKDEGKGRVNVGEWMKKGEKG